MNVLIGADPEVFVRRDQAFVSAHTLRCGTKRKPRKTKNGSIQVDGMALEFNTRPTDDPVKFVSNVRALLEDLNVVIRKKMPGAELVADPVAHFDEDYILSVPGEARELGCEPDFNAYTHEPNPKPNGHVPFRTGSGHVHVGWAKFDDVEAALPEIESLVRELDYYLGLPSLAWDKDTQRRQLYGMAGCYRPKEYGVEYRTLSNAWLRSDHTMTFVFNQTKKAFENWKKGVRLADEFGGFARDVINNNEFGWQTLNPAVVKAVLSDAR